MQGMSKCNFRMISTRYVCFSANKKEIINGTDSPFDQIEKDDSVSILRIHDVQQRDVGEIRCTASVAGKGPSISCSAELRLNRSTNENRNEKPPLAPPSCNRSNSLRRTRKDAPLASPQRRRNESPLRARSLPRGSTPSPILSPLPVRRNVLPPSPLLDRKSTKLPEKTGNRKDVNLKKFARKTTQRVQRGKPDERTSSDEEETFVRQKRSRETRLSENEEELVNASTMTSNVCKTDKNETRQDNVNKHDNTPIICVKHVPEEMEEMEEEECSIQKDDEIVMKEEEKIVGGEEKEESVSACIVKVPADVTVFRGNRVVLRVTYQGHPEPAVKWLRAVNIYPVSICVQFSIVRSL